MKILLASGSPRRQSLLKNYGFEVSVIKPDFDESQINEADPAKLVMALASGKMSSIETNSSLTLSADTVVAIDGQVLGKPENYDSAYEMLSTLSGNTHSVYTGVCISYKGQNHVFCEESKVTFYKLSDYQIQEYIKTGSPFDKAGSYGIQDDMGIFFVRSVEGEISNVIGLPMGRVIAEIERIIK